MRTQKVIKVGNSWAVTIPPELALKHGLEPGTQVIAQSMDKGVLYEPVQKKAKISKEFQQWLDKTAKQYGPALKKLAEK